MISIIFESLVISAQKMVIYAKIILQAICTDPTLQDENEATMQWSFRDRESSRVLVLQ